MTLDRRGFLAGSAAALATMSANAKNSPNEAIRVGVIGLHGRGQDHLKGFESLDNVDVVALCDVDPMTMGLMGNMFERSAKRKVKKFTDVRALLDDKDIDVVSIATPNHWHALMAAWAMLAGKDVYVEKPCSHNVSEGRRLIEIAQRQKKICQHGTQGRSSAAVEAAVAFMKEGGIGKVHTAKGLCYKWRPTIGKKSDSPTPKGLDYNLWLGPAPLHAFNLNRFHYNWHWFWDYGNGDLGNQGVHQMDVARWGLGKEGLPTKVNAAGGRYGYDDDGDTPNTLMTTYNFGDAQLVFEVRGLPTNDEKGVKIGNIWYGSDGYLALEGYGKWVAYKGAADKVIETQESFMKRFKPTRGGSHYQNFINAVRAQKPELLHAEIKEGHLSSALCHLGNIAYRLGRTVTFDPESETFGDDKDANRLLTREYRAPFTFPTQA